MWGEKHITYWLEKKSSFTLVSRQSEKHQGLVIALCLLIGFDLMTGDSSLACMADTTHALSSAGGNISSQLSLHAHEAKQAIVLGRGFHTNTHIYSLKCLCRSSKFAQRGNEYQLVCLGWELLPQSSCQPLTKPLCNRHSGCHMTPARTETSGDRAMND